MLQLKLLCSPAQHVSCSFLALQLVTIAHCDCAHACWLLAYCLQGVLGIKVRIMKEWDPTGKVGPRTPLPDVVTVLAPKVGGVSACQSADAGRLAKWI